ncbi:SPFH domain-containing protein [Streptomyces sp. NPDC058576]|uniref:SPFH domain-containing protein n=1 Tax=Streptomyces sp. NPDC058576 TaxID=3346547 RepID=UPI00364BFCA9
MTPNNDHTPRTSTTPTPTPHSLDDQIPPSLFAPPGRGTPPPLFGPVAEKADTSRGGATPPPLFGPVADRAVTPRGGELPPRRDAEPGPAPAPDAGPARAAAGELPPRRKAEPAPDAAPAPDGGRVPSSSPPPGAPEAPSVGLHLGPAPDRPAPTRPVPLDGNLHLKPVRRLRPEPSAEWTPHPSYGAEPGTTKREDGKAEPAARDTSAQGAVDNPGPDTELDLVLDLAPGDRAASATFSVPVPGPAPAPASQTTATAPATATVSSSPGRRHSVIANETTASIPVHLLFRDAQEPAEATALPAAVVRRPDAGDRTPATRRPPVPRSPQTRVRPSTRPAPVADPRLAERPGPALSGYAALLAGAAGTAGALAVLWWRGALPAAWQSAVGLTPRPDLGVGVGAWALLALLATAVLLALGGLGRGRVGYAWVLTLFGDYRGSVRRTGLVWVSPLLLRRRVDVRLRHWRSEPLPAVDANGTALRVVVLVVWRIKDTVRAVLGIEDHEAYLSAQVEAAMARVLSQLPADAFHEDAPTLRDAEAVGDALTRMLKADCEPVGVEVYSAQPTGIEYAPEVAAAMQRRRIAAIDSRHRDSVLTSVVDAVDDTVNRLTTRGIVELDDYERKALVKDLTVAFYTGRSGGGDGA